MKKTISITLGGRAYIVEEDAYLVLDQYLSRLKQHFSQDPSLDELIADIESSIADKFSDKLNEQKNVITKNDVEEVVSIMGQVEEIDEDSKQEGEKDSEKSTATDTSTQKRLYRDEDNMVIAGVCSGLAAYTGIDPVFIRILFVVLAFANGIGILAYLILWIAVPAAQTNAQKLEMRGKPVNLNELEEIVKEKAQTVSQEGRAAIQRLKLDQPSWIGKILRLPVLLVSVIWQATLSVGRAFGPVIRLIVGIPITLGAILAMLATSVITSIFLFRTHAPDMITNIPLQDLAQDRWYTLGVVAFGLTALIPLLFIMMVGLTILTRRNQFRALTSGLLIAAWIIAVSISASAAMRLGPTIHARIQQETEKQTATRSYDLQNIRNVELLHRGNIVIKQGETPSMKLKGLEADVENVDVKQENGTLKIEERNRVEKLCLFCIRRSIQGEIILPELHALKTEGISRATVSGFNQDLMLEATDASRIETLLLNQHTTATLRDIATITLKGYGDSLSATTQDASRLRAEELTVNTIDVHLSDASRMTLEGSAERLRAELRDVSQLLASTLKTNTVSVTTRDNARAYVHALQSLVGTSSDISQIEYEETSASTTLRNLGHGNVRMHEEE